MRPFFGRISGHQARRRDRSVRAHSRDPPHYSASARTRSSARERRLARWRFSTPSPMVVGILKLKLAIPENHSLKGKRGVVKSIQARVGNRIQRLGHRVRRSGALAERGAGICRRGNQSDGGGSDAAHASSILSTTSAWRSSAPRKSSASTVERAAGKRRGFDRFIQWTINAQIASATDCLK